MQQCRNKVLKAVLWSVDGGVSDFFGVVEVLRKFLPDLAECRLCGLFFVSSTQKDTWKESQHEPAPIRALVSDWRARFVSTTFTMRAAKDILCEEIFRMLEKFRWSLNPVTSDQNPTSCISWQVTLGGGEPGPFGLSPWQCLNWQSKDIPYWLTYAWLECPQPVTLSCWELLDLVLYGMAHCTSPCPRLEVMRCCSLVPTFRCKTQSLTFECIISKVPCRSIHCVASSSSPATSEGPKRSSKKSGLSLVYDELSW